MKKGVKIAIGVGVAGALVLTGFIIYRHNKKKKEEAAKLSSTSTPTSGDASSAPVSSSVAIPTGATKQIVNTTPYTNKGENYIFTNKPLVRSMFAGNDIQDVNGNKVSSSPAAPTLLGVAEKANGGFVYFVDKNGNRNRVIWKAANVVNGN